MSRFERIGKYRINLDDTYYIAYAGGYREVGGKDQKDWTKTLSLPLILQKKEQRKIPMKKNPNVFPIKGVLLLSFIRELNFVPLFDKFFEQSHLMKLTDLIVYESMKQQSYDVALKEM